MLSLNEIFLVAETYPRGSKEFKETLRLAADLFPDNAVANLNVATSDIETGDIDRAIERLNRISGTPDVWNNLGVAYAKKENLANAAKFFEKAGDSEVARYNLKELKKRLENN